MARIFICYRREDASGHAGRLRDALSARFGADEIFRDIETIGPGDDFVQAMTRAIAGCRVFLTVIGRDWLTLAGPDGRPRLLDPHDHVRREITEALRRGVRVIPVLVEGAAIPHAQELPDDVRGLASRNAVALDDPGWRADLDRLIAAIRAELGESSAAAPAPPPPVPLAEPSGGAGRSRTLRRAAPVAGVALAAIAILALIANLGGRNNGPPTEADDAVVEGGRGAVEDGDPPRDDPGAGRAVTLPRGGAVELGEALYEVLGATLAPHATGRTLTLRLRLTNAGRYGIAFGRGDFRLLHDDRTDAPTNDLSEVVEAQTTRDGELTFEVPDDARSATLRIMLGTETGDMPLDLTGRTGASVERDRQARSRGEDRFDVAVPAARSTMRFGEFALTVRAANLRRYTNKLELSLDVRADNASRYAAALGDGEFRLLVDGLARAPVSGVGELVAAASSKDVRIVFDLPLGTRDVVLRTLVGDATAELPLRLPDVD